MSVRVRLEHDIDSPKVESSSPAPPEKRQRPNPPSTDEDKHAVFTHWARGRGVKTDGIGCAEMHGSGRGIVSEKRISKGQQILFVPERALFKPDLALLEQEELQKASPQAQLVFAVMTAFNKPESEYRFWRESWPSQSAIEQSMPLCWPAAARHMLPETTQRPFKRLMADYQKDLQTIDLDKHGWSERSFRYHWLIVNSRSFHFRKHWRRPGQMVLCPFFDYMNHGAGGTGCSVTQGANGFKVVADRDYEPNTELLMAYGAHTNDTLLVHYGFLLPAGSADDSITLDSVLLPAPPSPPPPPRLQELGYLGNYSLRPTTREVCFRTEVAVRALAAPATDTAEEDHHHHHHHHHQNTNIPSPPPAAVPVPAAAAATALTNNELEYFAANGEDLGRDRTADVDAWVAARLEQGILRGLEDRMAAIAGLRVESPASGSEEEKEEQAGILASAKELLLERWRQIGEAAREFCDKAST